MYRLFVALALPAPIRDCLGVIQCGVEGAHWRPRENFHLTLSFLGAADRHDYHAALDALAKIEAPSFSLQLEGIGVFGDKSPKAVWASVAPSQALIQLQEKIQTAMRRAGFVLERRKFIPHVTLAYLRCASRQDVERYCAANGSFKTSAFVVEDFHFYSSQLGKKVSAYNIEASYALSSSR